MEVYSLFNDRTLELVELSFVKATRNCDKIEISYFWKVPDNIRESIDVGIKETFILLSNKLSQIDEKFSIWYRGFNKPVQGRSSDISFSIAFISYLIEKGYLKSNFNYKKVYATGEISNTREISYISGLKDKILAIPLDNIENSIFFYPLKNQQEIKQLYHSDPECRYILSKLKTVAVNSLDELVKCFTVKKINTQSITKNKTSKLIKWFIIIIFITITTFIIFEALLPNNSIDIVSKADTNKIEKIDILPKEKINEQNTSLSEGWADISALGVDGTTGGGTITPKKVTSLDEFKKLAYDSSPRVIVISGTIDTESDSVDIGSNKTIIGENAESTILGGIKIKSAYNVIIKNINIVGKYNNNPDDTITANNSHHLWFDHLSLSDAGDGLLDITKGSDYITVSWCKFFFTKTGNSNGVSLIGGSSESTDTDTGKNNATFHHNWFGESANSRMPRLLFGKGHIFNNYYNSSSNDYCIGSGSWASLYVENNYFENVNDPHRFQDDNPSTITANGNIYTNTNGNEHTGSNTSSIDTPESWNKPDYDYKLDDTKNIPQIVKNKAGPQ